MRVAPRPLAWGLLAALPWLGMALLPALAPPATATPARPKAPPDLPRQFAARFAKVDRAALRRMPLGQAVAHVATSLVGAPYLADTLAQTPDEPFVCELRGFDCVTLVETALALARASKHGDGGWLAFRAELEALRYRGGRRQGWASRLHYFSDWLADNAARGHLLLPAPGLDARIVATRLDFITTHRGSYKPLADPATFAAMRAVEAALAGRPRLVLPKSRLRAALPRLQSGDVVAFTTGIAGLDVVHTGIALRQKGGAVHLVHAPEPGTQVQVSRLPIERYTAQFADHTGVMVARPR